MVVKDAHHMPYAILSPSSMAFLVAAFHLYAQAAQSSSALASSNELSAKRLIRKFSTTICFAPLRRASLSITSNVNVVLMIASYHRSWWIAQRWIANAV